MLAALVRLGLQTKVDRVGVLDVASGLVASVSRAGSGALAQQAAANAERERAGNDRMY